MHKPLFPKALLRLVGFVFLAVLVRAGFSAAAEIEMHRLFGPEIPTGKYKHPASFDELSNGDLYLVYYGGDGEYAEGTAVFGSRLHKGTNEWSKPEKIASHPFRSLGNAVVWQAPDGVVWLFYVMRYGETWSTSRIAGKISRDSARTWSDAFPITFEEGTMVRSRPIVLGQGDFLLPIYHETGHDPEFTAPTTCSLFLRFDARKKTWNESNRVYSRLGNLQPAVAAISATHLIAYCRRGGDYEPRKDGYLVRTESEDGGKTWSAGKETSIPNPNAAVDFIALKNGHLLLVFNDSMNDRTPLTAAVSTDQGRTFAHRRDLVSGPGDFAYPTAVQTRDGKIRVVFTSDERTVIRMAEFEEGYVLRESN
ncbi:MAG: sialidase family protein [Verrucomicrobiota bacterium]